MSLFVRYTPIVIGGFPPGVLSIGTIDSQTPSANGAVIVGTQLFMQSASITVPGLVNNTTQSFSGVKTFTSPTNAVSLAMNNTAAQVSLGSALSSNSKVSIAGVDSAITTGSSIGFKSVYTANSNNTSNLISFLGNSTTAASVSVVRTIGIEIDQPVLGAGASIGTNVDIFAGGANYHIATNNAALSDSLSIPGNYFIYQAGTDPSTLGGSITAANLSGTNTGDVTLAAFGSTPNANGASLSGQVLTLQPANATNPGGVSITTQSFSGTKTFIDPVGIGAAPQVTSRLQSTSPTSVTGTASNSASGTIVTGVGTKFLTEFKVGNTVTMNAETRTIATITSDTTLTTDAWTGANSGATMTKAAVENFFVYPNGTIQVGGSRTSVTNLANTNTNAFFIADAPTAGATVAVPTATLSLIGYTGAVGIGSNVPTIQLFRAHGNEAAMSPLVFDDTMGTINFRGATSSTTFGTGPRIRALATEAWTPTTVGSKLEFITIPNGTAAATIALTIGQDQSGVFTGALSASNLSGTNTGDVTLTAFGSTPNANGASLSGQALTLQPADATNPGGVSTTTQSFAGAKTFTSPTAAVSLAMNNTAAQISVGGALATNSKVAITGVDSAITVGSSVGFKSTYTTNANNTSNLISFLGGITTAAAVSVVRSIGLEIDAPTLGAGATIATHVDVYAGGAASHIATNNASLSDTLTIPGNYFIYQVGTDPSVFGGSLTASNFSGSSSGTNTGDVTLAAFGSTPSTSGASLSGQVLTLQPADATHGGGVSTTTQTFAGAKTFTGAITASNFTGSSSGTNTGDVTFAAFGSTPSTEGASLSGQVITLQPADATHGGGVSTTTQTFAGAKTFTGAISASNLSGTNTGDVTLTAVGATPNANAASLSGQALTLQPADATNPGVVTAGTQTFGGAKTFTGTITASNFTGSSSGTNTGDVTLSAFGSTPNANGASLSGQALTLQPADATNPGGVSTTTQTFAGAKTFTGTITASNFTGSSSGTNTGDVTIGTANGLSIVGQVLSLALSSTSTTGALSSTDWNTFNNKQAAGNYITALTGDATATGPGSVPITLATVNANVGSFTNASITVNAKGLITAASSATVTGTGDTVLATSPTLITPVIGVATGTSLALNSAASSRLSVGGALATNAKISIVGADTSITVGGARGLSISWQGNANNTSNMIGALIGPTTPAGVTLTRAQGIEIDGYTLGAAGTLTSYIGVAELGARNHTATNNASFTDNQTSTGNWFLNQSGSDANLLTGQLGIGFAPAATSRLQSTSPTSVTGTASNSAAGTAVTGVGTKFLTEFKVGNAITMNAETRTVATITSDTTLTTDAWTGANSGATVTKDAVENFFVYPNGTMQIGGSRTSVTNLANTNTNAFFIADAPTAGATTAVPTATLSLIGYTGAVGIGSNVPTIQLFRAHGNEAAMSSVVNDDTIGTINFRGATSASTFGTGPRVRALTTEAWTTTTVGSKLEFLTIPNGTTTATIALTIGHDQSATLVGNLITSKAVVTNGYDTSSPASAGTVTASANTPGVLITPAGTIATCTIKLPSSPIDGQQYWVASSQIITAVTWQDAGGTAGNVVGGPATIGGTGRGARFVYNSSGTTWYNIG